ncbi:MAG TPA: hypothetical protein PLU43_04830, partial [Lachnospiraceae bacterium]|nr:hypothetical protein [Lachnospiraceae bacterium]
DYYYLPEEDCCIHKSAAMAVDKDHRLHAKKETCYTKHTGLFLPQFSSIITPYFQTEYKTKILYFEYNRDNMTPAAMNQYGTHLLNFFCG